MTTRKHNVDPIAWYVLLLCILGCLALCGCGAQDRRDRFVAQAAADIDAQVSAIEQGGDTGQGLSNIRTLAHAQAEAVGFQIQPTARPVYVPALEKRP